MHCVRMSTAHEGGRHESALHTSFTSLASLPAEPQARGIATSMKRLSSSEVQSAQLSIDARMSVLGSMEVGYRPPPERLAM